MTIEGWNDQETWKRRGNHNTTERGCQDTDVKIEKDKLDANVVDRPYYGVTKILGLITASPFYNSKSYL